jgi:hypothetical protein
MIVELRVAKERSQAPMGGAELPVVSNHVAQKLVDWLKDREQMQRPPEATAKVLAFIILAYEKKLPFPTRPELAAHLGISVPSVDVVLSQRQGTKDIRIISRLKKGNVQQRVSTIKFRIVIPTNKEMVKLVLDAVEEDRAAQAAMRPKRRRRKEEV